MSVVENTPSAWTAASERPFSWEAAGWSRAGQEDRFRAVASHLDLKYGDTLLDFGAGTGRLCQWFPGGMMGPTVEYHAYDWSAGMRDRCRRDHPHAIVHETIPLDETFDHVVAVGTFNLPGSSAHDHLAKLWGYTRKTLVVSLYRGDDERCLRYEPAELLAWVEELGAVRWTIDASYLDNDLLLVVRR